MRSSISTVKILHSSDWHLGKKLETYSRFEEQVQVLREIADIADREGVDAVLVAGDLFDTFNPPVEAVDLFYKTLQRLTNGGRRPVVCIAGNHDSPDRIEAPDPLARSCGIVFVGYPNSRPVPFQLETGLSVSKSDEGFVELRLPHIDNPLRLILMPYANEARLRACFHTDDTGEEMREIIRARWQQLADTYCDDKGVNVLIHHLFMVTQGSELPPEPDDEKPMLYVGGAQAMYTDMIPKQIQYVACGHLHRPMTMAEQPCPVVYSGSPLVYSFGEANQDKFVYLVELSAAKKADISKIALTVGRPLLRQRFSDIDLAVAWLQENPNALIELTIESGNYITAEEKARLYAAHSGIVTLIPEVPGCEAFDVSCPVIDLSKNIDELFVDYFKYRQGDQMPNPELMALFIEVLAEGEAS